MQPPATSSLLYQRSIQPIFTMGVLSGNEATQALKHIVKAIFLYTETGNTQRTQILKGYAWGVFDLQAFSNAYMEETDERAKLRLGQLSAPATLAAFSNAFKQGTDGRARQALGLLGVPDTQTAGKAEEVEHRQRTEQVAADLVWAALAEIQKVDEQKAEALRRVLYEEHNETRSA